MNIQQLIKTILSMDAKSQKELLNLCKVIKSLYKQYGTKLLDSNVLQGIKDTEPELAKLIATLDSSIGLNHVDQIISSIQKENAWEMIDIYTQYDKPNTIINNLKQSTGAQEVEQHATWWIGIKIVSSSGKQYERSLNRDLETLTK